MTDVKRLTKETDEQRQRVAELTRQLGEARDTFRRLTIEVDAAGASFDARETAKLPQLSAEKLATQNRIGALERAVQTESATLATLQKQLADAEDAEDDAAVEALAGELRNKVYALLDTYMTRIEGHEQRILRHKHAMALRSHGIAHLRQMWQKERTRAAQS